MINIFYAIIIFFLSFGQVSAMQNRGADPSRLPVQNQMETQTQNQGESDQLRMQVQTRETAGTPAGDSQPLTKSEDTEALVPVNSRHPVLKFLIGPDYQALKDLSLRLEQNQTRLQELNQLRTQLQNESEDQSLTEMVSQIEAENLRLQDQINQENKSFSLFGWLFRIFAR